MMQGELSEAERAYIKFSQRRAKGRLTLVNRCGMLSLFWDFVPRARQQAGFYSNARTAPLRPRDRQGRFSQCGDVAGTYMAG